MEKSSESEEKLIFSFEIQNCEQDYYVMIKTILKQVKFCVKMVEILYLSKKVWNIHLFSKKGKNSL